MFESEFGTLQAFDFEREQLFASNFGPSSVQFKGRVSDRKAP